MHLPPPCGAWTPPATARRLPTAPADVFFFDSQTMYENGGFMCTSACVCMGVMFVSGHICPCVQSGSDGSLRSKVTQAMRLASGMHGIVERRLWQQENLSIDGMSRRAHNPHRGRMVGVKEAFSKSGIRASELGICTEELVVCLEGRGCVLEPAKPGDSGPLRFSPSKVFITAEDLPSCMLTTGGQNVACVITSSGHSLCILYDGKRGDFSVFDPMPSCMSVGVDRAWVAALVRERAEGGGREQQCDATLVYLKSIR